MKVADPGTLSGSSYVLFSSQISTTLLVIDNTLYSGIAPGKVLIVREDTTSHIIMVMSAHDPGIAGGTFVVVDKSLTNVGAAIKDVLYGGL